MKKTCRILALFLCIWLNLYQPAVVTVVLAEESGSGETSASATESSEPQPPPPQTPDTQNTETSATQATSTETQESQNPPSENTESQTPTTTPPTTENTNTDVQVSSVEITTGDASAGSGNGVEVNTTSSELPGEAGTCNLQIGCSEVNNSNTADVGSSNNVEADSGNNEIGTTANEATITSGDANSLIISNNLVNENQVILVVVPGTTGPETSTAINSNTADVNNSNNGSGNSGNNNVNNSGGDGTINSGNVTIAANVLNQVNTNQIGSDIKIYLLNDGISQKQDLDLNQIWREMLSGQNGGMSLVDINSQTVINQNYGDLSNLMLLSGNSGNNSLTAGGSGIITTGDVTILGNLINLLNLNLIGSKIFLGVINIRGELLGDLILPNPELFNQPTQSGNSAMTTVDFGNYVQIINDINVDANSGENQASSNTGSNMSTGNAAAITNVQNFANMNINGQNQFMFGLNTLGNWSGDIVNWAAPGATSTNDLSDFLINPIFGEGGTEPSSLTLINRNEAYIYNQMQLLANSGGNILSAESALMSTGNVAAIANIFNLANLNIYGSNWFWGTINIIGDWKGNAIFAYPDLTVNLTTETSRVKLGESVRYILNYKNAGYDDTPETEIEFEVPDGFELLSENSGLSSTRTGNKIVFRLNGLRAGTGGVFEIILKSGEKEETAFWTRWVKPVYAAEIVSEKEVSAVARISSSQTETTLKNNSSSVATIVWEETAPSDNKSLENNGRPTKTNQLPKLNITAKNNVNDFVYPGDTVTFEIEIDNSGDDTARKSYLVQQIFDEKDTLLRTDTVILGDIETGKQGRMELRIKMPTTIKTSLNLKTISQVVGYDSTDNEIRSNEAITTFRVKPRGVPAAPNEVIEPQVLGTSTETTCPIKQNNLPYLMLFVISGFWLQKQSGLWLKKLRKK